MMHSVVILSIFLTVIGFSSLAQAGTISLSLSQSKPILYSAALAGEKASFAFRYAQAESRIDSIYREHTRPDSLKMRNPNIALLMAILPGSVVHGAGHFYAGRLKTGFFLLGVEVVSVGLTFVGALYGLGQIDGGSEKGDPDVWIFSGVALFLGSWIYDIIGAPLIVHDENEKILERSAGLKYSISF